MKDFTKLLLSEPLFRPQLTKIILKAHTIPLCAKIVNRLSMVTTL